MFNVYVYMFSHFDVNNKQHITEKKFWRSETQSLIFFISFRIEVLLFVFTVLHNICVYCIGIFLDSIILLLFFL